MGSFWEPKTLHILTIKGGRSWEGKVDSGSRRNLPRGYSSGSTLGGGIYTSVNYCCAMYLDIIESTAAIT